MAVTAVKAVMRAHIPQLVSFRSYVASARLSSSLITADDASPKPFDAMPGPKPLPFIGNSWELKNNLKRLNHYYRDGFEKYGDIYRLRGMGNYSVLVKDPSTIENVLRAEGKYPERDSTFVGNFCWLLNRLRISLPLPFLSGKEWKEVRSAVGKQIIPRNVQIYHHGLNDIIHRFTHFVRSSRNPDGFMQDLADPVKRLLVDLSAFTAFGTNWDVVANPSDEDIQFIASINFVFEVFFRIATELPMYKLYNNKLSRELKTAYEHMYRRSEAEVDRICELVDSGRESDTPGMLEQWLREGKLNKETAINEAQSLFPAGVDTTSNQSTFLLHAVAANEEVQDRLYEEIRAVLGQDTLPLPEHLSKMPFLKGCLQESYRLHSTAGTYSRVLQEDTVLHGYHVPKDTTVTYSIFAGGRDSSLFRDPFKFDPERWKRDDTHAFAVQPFGFGPRSCYGRRFAELEMKLLLVQMVHNFKMSTSIKNLKTVERTMMCPGEDVTIHFEDRKH